MSTQLEPGYWRKWDGINILAQVNLCFSLAVISLGFILIIMVIKLSFFNSHQNFTADMVCGLWLLSVSLLVASISGLFQANQILNRRNQFLWPVFWIHTLGLICGSLFWIFEKFTPILNGILFFILIVYPALNLAVAPWADKIIKGMMADSTELHGGGKICENYF
ncbi:hypothetical protein C4J81_05140 [Deltaproteobacteria bacterium Smac51]|nr:hypothetical protein C4J81_05140 [Deltaproteobacteria bacterium Smac51]